MLLASNIATIQTIFSEAKELALQCADINNLFEQLNALDLPYTSVAFEGAAMGLALTDLKTGSELPLWTSWKQLGAGYNAQINVGLGWALAESNTHDLQLLNAFTDVDRWRVVDGLGYYSGLFLRRSTIRNQQYFEGLPERSKYAFDQGVGRASWYLSKGEIDRLHQITDLFANDRKPHMWRGIGIALTYVAGVDNKTVIALEAAAGAYSNQLKTGVLLALESIQKANENAETRSTIVRNLFTDSVPELRYSKDEFLSSITAFEARL